MQISRFILTMALLSTAHSHTINPRSDRDDTCSHPPTTGGVPLYQPITPAQAGPIIPASGYRVEAFGQGAYMVTDGIYQALFLVSTAGVIVVDSPPTIGRDLLYAIRNITTQPITHLIYSHAHADHIGGAYLFLRAPTNNPSSKLTIIAHAETAKLLAQTPDRNRPAPTLTFETNHTVTVGNQTVQLSYHGPAHLAGNIDIYAPAQRLLMLVDVIYPGWTPFTRLGVAVSVPEFIAAHDRILRSYEFEHFVGGHLNRGGRRADVRLQREYVDDLYKNCEAAIARSADPSDPVLGYAALLEPVVAVNPKNVWAQFAVYLEAVAGVCAEVTNRKWGPVLAAADVFQRDNAEAMVESLRIDYGILGPFAVD
jgi:glyoxylase-like metal-dependent hydrolase (beta-lactamase superfamily II)